MPLTSCPDCGREISSEAPACIHCGRPLAPTAKPMAGIVAALLFGAATFILVMLVALDPYYPDAIVRLTWASRIALVLGNLALIVSALMSLAGDRRGHGLVRTVSKAMIAAVAALLLAWWWVGAGQPLADGASEKPSYFPLIATATVIFTAPWWLCLYLFRKARYP